MNNSFFTVIRTGLLVASDGIEVPEMVQKVAADRQLSEK